ncbi:NUDIX hydrolase [Actinomycetospora flava]|uniref:NUDIX hydrolase n=1 Tax=Actinomycetospora flava TaxID=3129232 RepID=UPI0035A07D79
MDLIPWGKVEPDETVEQDAIRETDEESCYRVRPICVLRRRLHPTTGAHITYVAAEVVTRPVAESPAPEAGGEEVVAYWRPVPEALRLLVPDPVRTRSPMPGGAPEWSTRGTVTRLPSAHATVASLSPQAGPAPARSEPARHPVIQSSRKRDLGVVSSSIRASRCCRVGPKAGGGLR